MRYYSVIVTKAAADDAIEIIRYISDNLKNKKKLQKDIWNYIWTPYAR